MALRNGQQPIVIVKGLDEPKPEPEKFPEPTTFPDEPYVPPKPPPPKPERPTYEGPGDRPEPVSPKPSPKPSYEGPGDRPEYEPFPEVTPWPDETYVAPVVTTTPSAPLVTGPPPSIDYAAATTAEIDQYTKDYLASLSDEELRAVSGGYKVGFDWGTTVIKSEEAREAAIELAARMFLEKEAADIEKTKVWRQARYELGRRGIKPFTGTEAEYYAIPRGKPSYMSEEAWVAAQKRRKAYIEKKAYAEVRLPRESMAEWKARTGGLIPAAPLGVRPLLMGEVPDAQKAFSDYVTASEAFDTKWGSYLTDGQYVLETDRQVQQFNREVAALGGLRGGLPYIEEGKIDVFPALAGGVSPETLKWFGVTGPLEDMAKVAPFIGAGGILTLASVKALTDKYGVTKTQSLLSTSGVEGAAVLAPLAPYVRPDDTINVEGLIDKYGTRRATAILTAAGVEDARGKVSGVAHYEIVLEGQKVAAKEYEEFIEKTVPTREYAGYGVGTKYLELVKGRRFVPTPELYYSMHPEMTAGDVVKSYRKLYGGKEPTEVPPVGFVGSPPVSYSAFTAQFLEAAKETAPDFSRAQFPHRAEELWGVEMAKVAGEKYRELYGTRTYVATAGTEALATLVAPARALHPEVTVKDIKAWEWGLGAVQVATLAAPVWVPKVAGFASPITKIASRIRPQFPITRAGLRGPFHMKPLPPPTAPVYPIVTEPFGFPGAKAPLFRGMPPVADGYGLEAVSRFAPKFYEIYPKSWAFEYPPLTRAPVPTVGGRLVPTEVIPGKGWGIPLEPEWAPYIYGGRVFPPGKPLPTGGVGTAVMPTTRTMTEEAVARQLAAMGYEYPITWAVAPGVKPWPFPLITPITQPLVSPITSPFVGPTTAPVTSPITDVALRSLSRFGVTTAVAPAVVVEPVLVTEPVGVTPPFVPSIVVSPPWVPPPIIPPTEAVPPIIPPPPWFGFPSLKEGVPKRVRPKRGRAPLGMWISPGMKVVGPHPLRRELVGGFVGAFRRRYGAVEPRRRTGVLSTRTSGSTGSYNAGRQFVPTMVGG